MIFRLTSEINTKYLIFYGTYVAVDALKITTNKIFIINFFYKYSWIIK
jgi:hypothetical protein